MRLILVRHGESEANAKGINQGQYLDTPLTKKGVEQAKKVAKRLKEEKIDMIYSSDLIRAKQTAREINKFHDLKIIFDKRIREKDHPIEESENFISRVKSFFDEIKDKSKNILIVAHGGVNLTLLAISTGDRQKGGEIVRRYRQSNTCVNVIEKDGENYKIKLVNCIKHFKSDKKLIKIFEEVQKSPYQVCPFKENKIDENIESGDCRYKFLLLKKLLDKERYKTKIIKVIFNWKDLPIPKNILRILKKSSTVWVHNTLAVKIHGDYLFIDPIWNPQLEKRGFPVTKNWNGLEDTKQISEGKLEFFKKDLFEKDKEKILKENKVYINKDEAHKFAEALNKWLNKK